MYQINNRKEAIKEIQTALFKLGYGETHLVAIDGIWGENTRCAILHFQRENIYSGTNTIYLKSLFPNQQSSFVLLFF